jgi:hypothetical protein
MPAKHSVCIIVSDGEVQSARRVLSALWSWVTDVLGNITTLSMLHCTTGATEDYAVEGAELPDLPLIGHQDILFLYPEDYEKGSVHVSLEGHSFVITVARSLGPVSAHDMRQAWRLCVPHAPVALLGGEELGVYERDVRGIRDGTLSPMDVPLCEIAAVPKELFCTAAWGAMSAWKAMSVDDKSLTGGVLIRRRPEAGPERQCEWE